MDYELIVDAFIQNLNARRNQQNAYTKQYKIFTV